MNLLITAQLIPALSCLQTIVVLTTLLSHCLSSNKKWTHRQFNQLPNLRLLQLQFQPYPIQAFRYILTMSILWACLSKFSTMREVANSLKTFVIASPSIQPMFSTKWKCTQGKVRVWRSAGPRLGNSASRWIPLAVLTSKCKKCIKWVPMALMQWITRNIQISRLLSPFILTDTAANSRALNNCNTPLIFNNIMQAHCIAKCRCNLQHSMCRHPSTTTSHNNKVSGEIAYILLNFIRLKLIRTQLIQVTRLLLSILVTSKLCTPNNWYSRPLSRLQRPIIIRSSISQTEVASIRIMRALSCSRYLSFRNLLPVTRRDYQAIASDSFSHIKCSSPSSI